MLLKSQKNKGFLFTVEAIVVLIMIFYLFFHFSSYESLNLNNEILFMQVQDITEVCSLKKDYSLNCIKQLEEINPHIKIKCVSVKKECKNPLINRDYIQVTAKFI